MSSASSRRAAIPTDRLRLVELSGVDRLRAEQKAERWGFPRPITTEELVLGQWFGFGPEAVFWLVPDLGSDERDFAVHVASAPGSGVWRRAREWEAVLVVLGDLLGADSIFGQPIPGSAVEKAVAGILGRLGWTRRGLRWYLSLRGDGGGSGSEAGKEQTAPDDRGA